MPKKTGPPDGEEPRDKSLEQPDIEADVKADVEPVGPTPDSRDFDELFLAVLDELRKIVRRIGRHKVLGLSTTEVVDEMYPRMKQWLGERRLTREHFLYAAARAIRHFLVDVARKRPKVTFVTLPDVAGVPYPIERHLDIDRTLRRLDTENPELARFIDLRFYAGCTDNELAKIFKLSTATVQRRNSAAQAWIKASLKGELADSL